MEKIYFYSNNQRIDGTLITPKKTKTKNPGVIFFHGMTSSEKGYIPIAESLTKNGIISLTLNLRGHGSNQGNLNTLTVNDAVADAFSAYDFFTQHDFVDKKRIGLCGTSVGAAIASIVSKQREVKSLVLRSPAAYTDKMMKMTYSDIMAHEGLIFQKIKNIRNTTPLKAIAKFKGSLLVITSENDTIIPVRLSRQYLSEAKGAKKKMIEISGAAHNLLKASWKQQFRDEVVKWFIKTL